jgi:hypothetical protein
MPPFFTDGACTAEFDEVARQIQKKQTRACIFGIGTSVLELRACPIAGDIGGPLPHLQAAVRLRLRVGGPSICDRPDSK